MLLVMILVGFGLTNAQTSGIGGVTGIVISADDDEPVVGASVMVKGTKVGTSTDIDGRFSITLPPPIEGKQLQVSYIGYIPQTVTLKSTEELTIKMIEDSQNLDEVVVIGYGTQRKGDVTSSSRQRQVGKLRQRRRKGCGSAHSRQSRRTCNHQSLR